MGATVTWRGLFQACQLPLKLVITAKLLTQFQSGIAKRWRITRNNNQYETSKKRLKTCDNDCQPPWSDLNHDVLLLVVMHLGVVDFYAFSGVCKSWRSLSLSNSNKFMASRPPMSTSIFTNYNGTGYYYHSDNIKRRFRTILPHYAGRTCVGTTCGYFILFGIKTHDFWLVNRKIRHELHFYANPLLSIDNPERIRGVLVFSPLMSGWVFVMTDGSTNIWFSIAGQKVWNQVSSTFPIVDLHAFKGKMYTINSAGHSCELRLNPQPKLMLLEMKNLLYLSTRLQFFSSHDRLYVMRYLSGCCYEFHMLDFDKMKWVACARTGEAWPSSYGKGRTFFGNEFHVCLNDNLINE